MIKTRELGIVENISCEKQDAATVCRSTRCFVVGVVIDKSEGRAAGPGCQDIYRAQRQKRGDSAVRTLD